MLKLQQSNEMCVFTEEFSIFLEKCKLNKRKNREYVYLYILDVKEKQIIEEGKLEKGKLKKWKPRSSS